MKRRTKRLLWAAAILLLLAELLFVNRPADTVAVGVSPGERLADFSVSCLDGSVFRLSEQRGKVVVINLWATWCSPCVKELPNFDRLQDDFPGDLAVLALHSPPVTADVGEYLSGYSYGILFAVDEDGGLSEALGASTVLPQTLIVDPNGVVTYNQSGALSEQRLRELVAEAR